MIDFVFVEIVTLFSCSVFPTMIPCSGWIVAYDVVSFLSTRFEGVIVGSSTLFVSTRNASKTGKLFPTDPNRVRHIIIETTKPCRGRRAHLWAEGGPCPLLEDDDGGGGSGGGSGVVLLILVVDTVSK